MIQKAAAMGNWWLAASSPQHTAHASCPLRSFLVKHQITQVTQTPYSPDSVPCALWLFPKLKSLLKEKRFQTVDEIQENTTGQLMATGRTAWGPKVPSLKGTEVSLFYVQCFCIFFNKCRYFSYYMVGYLTDRPRVSLIFVSPVSCSLVLFYYHLEAPYWLAVLSHLNILNRI